MMTEQDTNALIREMQATKMLLLLLALAAGYKQKHLAAVLGVSEATLSRMLPKGFSKERPNRVGGSLRGWAEG
jgi:DNA-binding transcriptional regulator LsrR (DeoR family)